METDKVVNFNLGKSQAKRSLPLLDKTVESRKLLNLYFDRDYIIGVTEDALLDRDLMGIWKMRAMALAWKESPSDSLPTDEVKLMRLMAIGDADLWSRVKDEVLAEWIGCEDGRLYNRDVASRIGRSWRAYKQRQDAAASAAAKKAANKAKLLEHNDNSPAGGPTGEPGEVTSSQFPSRRASGH